jgi:glycosyltransferase involved in cell wall biosynthesis
MILAPAAFASQRYSSFDLIHAHGDSEFLIRCRVPVVRTFYGSARDEARHAVTAKQRVVEHYHYGAELVARRLASQTVGISHVTAASIGKLDHIIPCGVDRERFYPGAKSDHPTVVFIGTMRGRKRGDLVARVFRESVRPRVPDAKLILIAPDAQSEPGIEAIRHATDEQVAECLRGAWVFTLPSTYEGFGVPYIEAMASGTAVVATPNRGAMEILQPGQGGILVKDDELGGALTGLLRDEVRRTELGAGGRRYSRRFDWSEIAKRYEGVYDEVLPR